VSPRIVASSLRGGRGRKSKTGLSLRTYTFHESSFYSRKRKKEIKIKLIKIDVF